MSTKFGGQGNSSTEEEEDVEQVEGSWDEFVDGEFFLEADRNKVEEGEHGEYGHEHGVVDDRRVAGESGGNHVTDESHDDGREDQLFRCQDLLVTRGARWWELTSTARRPSCTMLAISTELVQKSDFKSTRLGM